MPIMTNNLRIDLKKPDLNETGHFIDPAAALAPYEFDANQLGAEFVHRLGD